MNEYIAETFYYDSNHPVVKRFVANLNKENTQKQQVIDLYVKVRDGWWYDPYSFHTSQNGFKASEIMQRKAGHCLDKSVILIACLRSIGVPARIHLAKVKNHIGVERIIEMLGTDELSPHGYVEVYLEGNWVACTPAFNRSLCEKLQVDVLEFDGENDSIFQAFDQEGGKFMEYLDDFGTFVDFPYDFVMKNLEENYPKFSSLAKQLDVFRLSENKEI